MPAPDLAIQSLVIATNQAGTRFAPGLLASDDLAMFTKEACSELIGRSGTTAPPPSSKWNVRPAANAQQTVEATIGRWIPKASKIATLSLAAPLPSIYPLQLPPLLQATNVDGVELKERTVQPQQTLFGWNVSTGQATPEEFTVVSERNLTATRVTLRRAAPFSPGERPQDLLGTPIWSDSHCLGMLASVNRDRIFTVVANLHLHTFLPALPTDRGEVGFIVREVYGRLLRSVHDDLRRVAGSGLPTEQCTAVKSFLGEIAKVFAEQAAQDGRGVLLRQLLDVYVQNYYRWNDEATTRLQRQHWASQLEELSDGVSRQAIYVREKIAITGVAGVRSRLEVAAAGIRKYPEVFLSTLKAIDSIQQTAVA